MREIYIPCKADRERLRSLIPQLERILEQAGTQQVDFAFRRRSNCALNALQHVGYRYTLTMDLEDFFNTISYEHVKRIIPRGLLSQCFIDGSPKQGLPTSPLISTLAFLRCDKEIAECLKILRVAGVYTRYADDLIFSFNDKNDYIKISTAVKQIVERNGFRINKEKTRLQDAYNGRIIITGIAVGKDGLHPTRRTKKKLRAAIHQGNANAERGLREWAACKLPV